ncbi:MAG TPA: DUF3570 domain-containing protein [Opitutaceae bacterium]
MPPARLCSPSPPLSAPTLVLAGCLLLLPPRSGRAETVVAYKYQDYAEKGGRIAVEAQYGMVEQSLGTDAKLKLTGVVDAIAGATPTGQPAETPDGEVPLAQLDDRRKAWTADLSRQFGRTHITLGAANSRESDYVSTGLSLNTLTDFRDKNTTLLAGIAGTRDDVSVFYQSERADKRTFDAIVGLSQLFGPKTSLSLNLAFGRSSGYLSDPYKIIQKTVEIAPGLSLPLTFAENRPDEREKWIGTATLNRTSERFRGSLEAGYRLYHDTFGTTSHTLSASWFQRLGARLIVAPSLRYYQQTAADFYHLTLDGTEIEPDNRPRPDGPFYSADYRLAKLRTWTYGVKLVWTPRNGIQLDAAYERYEMTGRDGITFASAFPKADILTAGVRVTW